MTFDMRHLPTCATCATCGVHACYHVHGYRAGQRCWIDVRGPGCGAKEVSTTRDVSFRDRWWLASRGVSQSVSGPAPGVLLLSTDDCAVVQGLVSALDCEHPDVANPEVTRGRAYTATARVAVFIEAIYDSGQPAAWHGTGGGIPYDAPAAFRLLGFVRVDPKSPNV